MHKNTLIISSEMLVKSNGICWNVIGKIKSLFYTEKQQHQQQQQLHEQQQQ